MTVGSVIRSAGARDNGGAGDCCAASAPELDTSASLGTGRSTCYVSGMESSRTWKPRALTALLCASVWISACGSSDEPSRIPEEPKKEVAKPDPAEALECEETLLRVANLLGQEVVAAKAETSCIKDTDCVLADVSVPCYGECPISIPGAQEAALRERVTQIGAEWCTAELRCHSSPSCLPSTPSCSEGRCVNDYGTGLVQP